MNIVKKLSKVIGFAVIGAVFSASVWANAADQAAKKEEFIKSLGLTPEQQTQVDAIMTQSHEDRMAIMKKFEGIETMQGAERMKALKAMRPEVEALHNKTQAELAKVLNDEQMMKVEEYQDEMMANAKARMGKK